MDILEKTIFYVIYGLMSIYIIFVSLQKKTSFRKITQVPIFKLLTFILLYFVCELDIIMGILFFIIIFLDEIKLEE